MKGESLTAVWAVTLQQRQQKNKEKETTALFCGCSLEVVMAPGEFVICLSIEGYANKPEPQ